MADAEKKFIYANGVRFEVTPHGLICCLKENQDKKHCCSDCKFCQWCSDSRCSLCLRQGNTLTAAPDHRIDIKDLSSSS